MLRNNVMMPRINDIDIQIKQPKPIGCLSCFKHRTNKVTDIAIVNLDILRLEILRKELDTKEKIWDKIK